MAEEMTPEEIKSLFSALRKINFFSLVPMKTMERMISQFIKKEYKKGEAIIKQGKAGTALYIIKSGSCLVYRKTGWFSKQDIATLKPGDFFGEMSLIFDNPTSASVMTAEPSELFMFMKSDFWYTLDGNTELQDQIRKIAEQRRKG